MRQNILLATLGSEPQVVTIAWHLLQNRSVCLAREIVIHTISTDEKIVKALGDLRQTFKQPPYRKTLLELRPIQRSGQPIADIATEEDAEATFRSIFEVVKREKQAGHRLHFSIAGGRKVMSTYGMAVAQLLFDKSDTLYHLLSEGPLLHERRMEPKPDDVVRLVPVPVLRWSEEPAFLNTVMRYDNPLDAMRHGREMRSQQDRARLHEFVTRTLSPAEKEITRLIVQEGLTSKAAGQKLCRSPKTIANQLSSVYGKLAQFLELDESERCDRHRLICALHSYYQQEQE